MPAIFIPHEPPGETRVAATPESTKRLIKLGHTVQVQTGAGLASSWSDEEYRAAGATIVTDTASALAACDIVLAINVPNEARLTSMREGASLISFFWPMDNIGLVGIAKERRLTVFSMDAIPRITRAQKDDALSSQANLAGYRAVLVAANYLPKIMPMMMTPAGTIRPAKVVVIGAGVAGLQAIATARRLGAIVEVSDVRPEVKEQAHSLGATYIEVKSEENLSGAGGYAKEQSEDSKRKQQETLHRHLVAADAIITTALIPYRPAPKLISAQVVREMRPGSVIVDLAAERGGNCELTRPGEVAVEHGVTIVGTLNLPGAVPVNASEMYAKNVENVIADMTSKGGAFAWNLKDDIVAGALVTHAGDVVHAKTREAMGLAALPKPEPAAVSLS